MTSKKQVNPATIDEKEINPVMITTRITVTGEMCRGMDGILRVSDLLSKAKEPKWNLWYGDAKQYWINLRMLDQDGEMHDITREAVLAMNIDMKALFGC